jgi:hypothetical protein
MHNGSTHDILIDSNMTGDGPFPRFLRPVSRGLDDVHVGMAEF